jgi:RNA polymerase sigma-70 factor (ECF subfamily)
MAALDDGLLVARARQGEREAFGELVRRHQRPMLAIARSYFASEADAEDAVQEAFVSAFQALHQLAADARFAAWLARITVNAAHAILRRDTAKLSLADFASTAKFQSRLGAIQLTPATLASRGEQAEQLKAALGRLPEPQRMALVLRYAADMTYEQIAAYLDLPASTIRGRLHTAKQALKALLPAPDG